MHFVIAIQQIAKRHVVFWLHDTVDPPHEEWEAAYQEIDEYVRRVGCTRSQLSMLVVTDGGAPSSRERRYMAEHLPVPSAVVTTVLVNPLKRGIATAITWTNPRFLFTEPKQFQRALTHIGVGDHLQTIWKQYGELRTRMPANKTLDLIAEANSALPSNQSASAP